jgi:hypothetical protein
MTTAVALSTH